MSRSRRYYLRLRESKTAGQTNLASLKRPFESAAKQVTDAQELKRLKLVAKHKAELTALLEKQAKDMNDLKERQSKEKSEMKIDCDKAISAAKTDRDAKVARIESKLNPRISAVEAELDAVATALKVMTCEFCEEDFYMDEKPNWNEELGSIHCGECILGHCPKFGAAKTAPEGTCAWEHCESDGPVYTCKKCSNGHDLCEDCEADDGLHLCFHCGEFYHDDADEACCKTQRYGNPKFGMLKENYAMMTGAWPF